MRALIVEHGASRAALAAARALAGAGWTVGVGTPSPHTLATASRAVSRTHWVPNPHEDPARFGASIRDALEEADYDVVFGADDGEVLTISALRVGIPCVVPYPPHEALLRALDKLELAEAAAACGLGCPATERADDAALRRVDGPVIVKGSLHAPVGPAAVARHDASIEPDAASARERAAQITAGGGAPILQEVVNGHLMAMVCLADRNGELVAAFQQETSHTYPPRTGVTVRATSVPADPALVERVGRLLREVGWFGLAELQFLRPAGGEPKLIDFNGRFYGSLALLVGSGLNLPAAWAALATDRPLPPLPEPRVGVRYHWLEGDLRRAYAERRGGLVRDVAGCLRYAPGAVHSIARLRDPGPALRSLRTLGSRGLRRAVPGAGKSPRPSIR